MSEGKSEVTDKTNTGGSHDSNLSSICLKSNRAGLASVMSSRVIDPSNGHARSVAGGPENERLRFETLMLQGRMSSLLGRAGRKGMIGKEPE